MRNELWRQISLSLKLIFLQEPEKQRKKASLIWLLKTTSLNQWRSFSSLYWQLNTQIDQRKEAFQACSN